MEVGATAIAAASIQTDGCEALDVDGLDVEKCDTLVLTLDQGGQMPQLADVKVTNPSPAGCSNTLADALAVVAPPVIEASGRQPDPSQRHR